MTLPLPRFYEPKDTAELRIERAALVAEAALEHRERHGIKPASQDKLRVAAFGIDVQIGFALPGASLFVPGAVEDTRRTVEWLYRNLDQLTSLSFSMDTHRVFQVFHPAFWLDERGAHPAPFTTIFHEDVHSGKWRPIAHPRECLEYTRKLEQGGKYVLTIWPYHTLLGGVSHALVPAVMEAAIFHSVCRQVQTHFETKGTHAMTENYSVMSPEVKELAGKPIGSFNASFFKMLMEHDRVYVFGQAKSHCVLSTLKDMAAHVEQTDPALLQKVWLLDDATSPVPPPPLSPLPAALDFPAVAEAGLALLAKKGMRRVKTTDPINL